MKPTFEEINKLYMDFMKDQAEKFFEVSGSGWTNKEYVDHIIAEQQMIMEYNEVVQPLIKNGMMYLN